MKQITKAARLLAAALLVLWPGLSLAATSGTSPTVLISELQTASSSDGPQEFVELYNASDQPVVLDGWTIEYASSSGKSWSPKATLASEIAAHGFYLLATDGYLSGDATMKSGLAATGGSVRIKNDDGAVVDMLGWGNASLAEGSTAPAPKAGGSLERLAGRLDSSGGNAQDSDNNKDDFVLRDAAEPQNGKSDPETPGSPVVGTAEPGDTAPTDQATTDNATTVTSQAYLPLNITELLPDPASPQSDTSDEYIELYNPNDQAVDLTGYVLRAGSDFHDYYTLEGGSLAPGAYMTVSSRMSHISLTNSGGAAELLDPLGYIVSVTGSYSAAKAGQAWALVNGTWQWTEIPTPGAANVLQSSAASATTTKNTTTAKKATAKATAKPKTTKTAAKPKAKSTKTKLASTVASKPISATSKLATRLLLAVTCITIGYGIYGFRHDIYHYYVRCKRYLQTWLARSKTMPWRRGNRTR